MLDQSDKSVIYRDLLNFIEYELTQKLLSTAPSETPLQGRVNRQVKHMPITPSITIKAGANSSHILEIVASDRPGLLSRLAYIFLEHGVALHAAKINTLGNRAEDTFTISAKAEEKLDEKNIKNLEKDLLTQL